MEEHCDTNAGDDVSDVGYNVLITVTSASSTPSF